MPNSKLDGPATYQIKVSGRLDASWSSWLNGMTITVDRESEEIPISTLTGPVTDQSCLRGLLAKIWDLNLVLISLNRIGQDAKMVNQNED